jgi:hypothetical protein
VQIVEALDLSDDPRVRKALREDESDLADILHTISQADDDRRAVLNLEGDEAQQFLDVVQDVSFYRSSISVCLNRRDVHRYWIEATFLITPMV